MDGIKLLIVDDEERIRELIKEYTSPEGYSFHEASDGVEAINLAKSNNYSLIILDVMMPRMDGWSVLREIRKVSDVPVIMLTARGEEYDKLFGFELGVDDYLVKPFSPKELLARMKAIIRRASVQSRDMEQEQFEFEGLVIEFGSRVVRVEGEPVSLTPKEFELLGYLSRNKNLVFSREQLLDAVWGYDFPGGDRTVDTHIKMLRESLRQYRKYIKTVWGTGYKFEVN